MSANHLPDYAGGSIVNLVQSIATACGSTSSPYPPLPALSAAQLGRARHIVLLVIDGLGQRTLARHASSPHLQHHLLGSMTSVFPSTTASAITTFMTGLAPAQHGLTGWHMHLDEIDQTLAILPLTPRLGPPRLSPAALPSRLFEHPSLFQRLDRESWVVTPQSIVDSPFNAWHSRAAQTRAYHSVAEMFACLGELLQETTRSRYVYAYYPDLDSCSHHYGTDSRQAQQTLSTVDTLFGELLHKLRGSNTWVLLTADHGFIDSPHRRVISLDDHPQLAALLLRPLCGERRVAYCYVAAANRPAFEDYVRRHLARAAHLYASDRLIAGGWFGPPPYHPRLASRIGDYTLVMKDNWTIKDWLPGEKHFAMLGVHGGISSSEMRVPLIALLA
ncbi:nucleotide pyrophosphatase/phosphodiesterase family protein [Candidatus Accumulibacter vicinus]|uniref:Type I phosphodiesterase / nucleotide pyrophosphatase n=1 Tax=Candidatus Accumulibacter vicinus TaxID=2954382 RepID=A0A084XYN5_9PROT|nr:nucleotide pyrophosphatase/phosphodiesterase family protein [Candidatus Accumulibacter vicinus]KFB67579.1 MAG: Type I phosphodiesterase / nucleotide pyrophosphatase [Candidatus Accumulibacter vicinus]